MYEQKEIQEIQDLVLIQQKELEILIYLLEKLKQSVTDGTEEV